MRKTDINRYRNFIKRSIDERVRKGIVSEKAGSSQLEAALSEFDEILNAEDLRSVEISTRWAKNPTWGMNPTSEGYVNARHVGTGHASGCGYDKHSAAANAALKDSLSIKKALIDKAMRVCYVAGTKTFEGLPYGIDTFGKITLGFGGCGMNTLRSIMEWLGLEKVAERDTKNTDYVLYEVKR